MVSVPVALVAGTFFFSREAAKPQSFFNLSNTLRICVKTFVSICVYSWFLSHGNVPKYVFADFDFGSQKIGFSSKN